MNSTEGNESDRLAADDGRNVLPSAFLLLRRAFRILKGCGISTAELKALSNQALDDLQTFPDLPHGVVSARQALACCDVVLKWRRDYRFLDPDGKPRPLNTMNGSPSWSELATLAAREETPDHLLRIMLELGVARMKDQSSVELASESVVMCPGKEKSAISSESVLEHVCGYLASVEYNLFDKPSRTKGKFERACYAWVPRKYVPVLEQLVSSRGQDFVDVIDEWLSRRTSSSNRAEDAVLVGAGAYVFVRDRLGG